MGASCCRSEYHKRTAPQSLCSVIIVLLPCLPFCGVWPACCATGTAAATGTQTHTHSYETSLLCVPALTMDNMAVSLLSAIYSKHSIYIPCRGQKSGACVLHTHHTIQKCVHSQFPNQISSVIISVSVGQSPNCALPFYNTCQYLVINNEPCSDHTTGFMYMENARVCFAGLHKSCLTHKSRSLHPLNQRHQRRKKCSCHDIETYRWRCSLSGMKFRHWKVMPKSVRSCVAKNYADLVYFWFIHL